MHIAVLGAGVIGMTTAYYLTDAGHDVTIFERGSETACGASHANGGQLSYSYTDTLAKPSLLLNLPKFALGLDPAIRIAMGNNAALAPWGMRVLRECTHKRAQANMKVASAITAHSKKLLDQLQRRLNLDFALKATGKLVLYSSTKEFNSAKKATLVKYAAGIDVTTLTFSEACQIEPALNHFEEKYVGAVYAQEDLAADCRQFCVALGAWLQHNTSTKILCQRDIAKLEIDDQQLSAIVTQKERHQFDTAVVCAGAWSNQLLQNVPLKLPVYPVRGYSISLPATEHSPKISLTDTKRRIVFSPLNGRLRIAGFADFTGFDHSKDPQRISQLSQIAEQAAPKAADYDHQAREPWGGYRPMTPTGLPIVGSTSIGGLYTNTGHGMLGWTMACASGYKLAQTISSG